MRIRLLRPIARGAFTSCVFAVLAANGAAQTAPQEPRASAAPRRIDTSEAPVIDGDLSDPGWAKATVLDEFRQRRPNPGAPATERTVLRIMYDENNLYLGIYCYDSQPDGIVVRAMERDGRLDTGDNVSIALDPGATRRNAYNFEVGPSGGRGDSLFLNNSEELEEWNPIWTARARIVADGWVAEMAIPFRSISYEGGQSDWGFEFSRHIARKNENLRWADHNPALPYTDVSQSGTLTGIADIDQGVGLDVQVYGALRAKNDWHIPGESWGITGTAGGSAFYKITPALTGTLTFNPDFSDAPLDERQVNTTRFSLFTPETRNFFLQDAAAFEFAGRNFSRGTDRSANNGRPFFSRNIGLVQGQQVGIVGGGKLSGRSGDFSIGALSVVTADSAVAPSQLLSSLRLTRKVLDESRVGVVFTNGDPTGTTDNTVGGADFEYRDSNWLGSQILQADLYYQRSFSSARGQDDSFGAAFDAPNEPWGWNASAKQIGTDFDPALGFVNRPGIRYYDGAVTHVTRYVDRFLQEFDLSASGVFVTDLENRSETRQSSFLASALTASDDTYELSIEDDLENVAVPFDVGDVTVPAGHYHWTNGRVHFESSERRMLAFKADISCCGYYGGEGIESEFELDYRPSAYYEASANYQLSHFDLPGGRATVHVVSLGSTVNFTPDMQIALQAQFDNISEDIGFLARYRWEFAPGDELFVAFGQAAVVPGANFVAGRSQFSVRVGHTFRF